MSNRLNFLINSLAESPQDPFLHYAIGLEIANQSPQEAVTKMEDLIAKFPYYLPAWQWLSNQALDREDYPLAASLLKSGLSLLNTSDTNDLPSYIKDIAVAKIQSEMRKSLYNLEIQGLLDSSL